MFYVCTLVFYDMFAFWAVFTFGGSVPAITAHGSLDLKEEIQIQIQIQTL
jgi:hypothetical protein